ncbi:MAG: hypothetical protein MI892_10460, partial [Desulfobacterales bacterium]|nr:hypothetical protein [Desulfobacterales bacterium]
WFYHTVCGFCRSVCWPDREDRIANSRLIRQSGTAALGSDGSHRIADDSAVTVATPYGLNVVINESEFENPKAEATLSDGMFPLDRAVIEHLRKSGIKKPSNREKPDPTADNGLQKRE